jgi:phosphohistidine phosphatase SixA
MVRGFSLGIGLLLGVIAADAGAAPAPPGLEEIRRGGFVIFFRHAATDPATADRDRADLGDCERQGILSEAGRADARVIGEAFRALAIPVGEVRSSPWCRCLETARLAFGRAEADPLLASIHGATGDEALKARLVAALKALLARPPAPGTNMVIVGHGFNLAGAARVPLAQGEAALFRPKGREGFELVGKVGPREWTALRRAGARGSGVGREHLLQPPHPI